LPAGGTLVPYITADDGLSPRLDVRNERLMWGARSIPLRPKTFAILRCLADHPGRLVTKDVLLGAAWPGTVVSDAGLMVCIRELRRVLNDDAQKPRFIQTVHRRGYRLIGDIVVAEPDGANDAQPPEGALPGWGLLVGRSAELARLKTLLDEARRGRRRLVFVTGEAGVGKTTVVEAFTEQARRRRELWVGTGQCIEQYGVGEPYLPVLEAFNGLCRRPDGGGLVDLLAREAPTWLVQMPGLLEIADLQVLQQRVVGSTRERMLREMSQAIAILTANRTLVLILEDLHWSDQSTLQLLMSLARSSTPARLLVIGTWRPAELSEPEHALHRLHNELTGPTCCELPLEFLAEAAVAAYLAARFPGRRIPAGLARSLHARTDGNPLFIVNVVDYWLGQGALVDLGDELFVRPHLEQLETGVPENLRQMIDKHLDRVGADEQRLLEVASVAGVEFSAASVAAGLDDDAMRVEARCERLSRRGHWLRAHGEQAWPDGTVAGRYRFVHALYAETIYARVAPGRRVQLHRRLGDRQEAAWASRAPEIAAELSVHFERGLRPRPAVIYRRHAATNALRRSANVEAVDHLKKALTLLEALPDGRWRRRRELDLRTTLGTALMAVKGYGAVEVEANYLRAQEVGEQLGETRQLFPLMNGLRRVHLLRGELATAHLFGQRCLGLAEAATASDLLIQAHCGLGVVLCFMGEFEGARIHSELGSSLYDARRHGFHALGSADDPGVGSISYAALALWYLGYPDQALQRIRAAVELAREQAHPFSLAYALIGAAWLHQYRREPEATHDRAEAVKTLSREYGFPLREAQAEIMAGWALAMRRNPMDGIAQIRRGLTAFEATGAGANRTYYLALLAEACRDAGQSEEGMRLLETAARTAKTSGEHWWEAELHRLRGELVVREGEPHAERSAEEYFCRGLEVARSQRAKSLELRSAVSLSRLWRHRGQRREAEHLLASVYGSFTEGFDTPDLREARRLLET
jgi:predicted ATPase/DNA-binding winged helix-turn-helix (wHTH) protein